MSKSKAISSTMSIYSESGTQWGSIYGCCYYCHYHQTWIWDPYPFQWSCSVWLISPWNEIYDVNPKWKVEVKVLVSQFFLTLCDSVDCGPPGFSIHGIFQARILEWVTISGDLPDPGIKLRSPALEADSLPSEPPEKPWPLNVQFSAQMPPPQRNPVTPLTWA